MARNLFVPLNLLVLTILLAASASLTAASSEQGPTKVVQSFRDCSDCPQMVKIPAGQFLMGSSAVDAARDFEAAMSIRDPSAGLLEAALYPKVVQQMLGFEQPQHRVTIGQSFALSKYPITRGEFAVFVRETGYANHAGCAFYIDHRYPLRPDADWQNPGFAQTDRDPVVCVSWDDANAYITWMNSKVTGNASARGEYRLPSDAEWEYAARAETQTAHWWGDSIGTGNANCDGCGSSWDKKQTAPVGSFAANSFGIADVLGNVWEWTADCWNKTYDGAPDDGRARTSGQCGDRVMRGGAWSSDPWLLRSAERSRESSNEHTNYIGFRVAKTLRK
jgi:formylglycine-generating enzyme required for sulfatase activity